MKQHGSASLEDWAAAARVRFHALFCLQVLAQVDSTVQQALLVAKLAPLGAQLATAPALAIVKVARLVTAFPEPHAVAAASSDEYVFPLDEFSSRIF